MRNVPVFVLLLYVFLAGIVLPACQPAEKGATVVSGKTVHGDLAIEDAVLKIHLWEESGWKYIGDSRSVYHGSFRLHLEPGEYLITAEGTLKIEGEEIGLYGRLAPLVVKEGVKRLDRIIIRMDKPQE